jgi:hypothetical protein
LTSKKPVFDLSSKVANIKQSESDNEKLLQQGLRLALGKEPVEV